MQKLTTLLLATFLGLLISCEKPLELENPQQIEELSTEEIMDAPEVDNLNTEAITISKIDIDGHVLYFDLIDEAGTMAIREKIPTAKENKPSIQESIKHDNPFELFISLTDQKIPVPKSIANTAPPAEVKASGRTIDPTNQYYEEVVYEISKGCYDTGNNNFRNTYCGGLVASSDWDIRFCDSGTWTSHVRSSIFGGIWKPLNKISTWTNVICGITTIKFYRFEYWVGGQLDPQWLQYYEVALPGGIWYVNLHNPPSYTKGNFKRVRRNASGGSFRAYTRFFSLY